MAAGSSPLILYAALSLCTLTDRGRGLPIPARVSIQSMTGEDPVRVHIRDRAGSGDGFQTETRRQDLTFHEKKIFP